MKFVKGGELQRNICFNIWSEQLMAIVYEEIFVINYMVIIGYRK
jgi:hypothetical protein